MIHSLLSFKFIFIFLDINEKSLDSYKLCVDTYQEVNCKRGSTDGSGRKDGRCPVLTTLCIRKSCLKINSLCLSQVLFIGLRPQYCKD